MLPRVSDKFASVFDQVATDPCPGAGRQASQADRYQRTETGAQLTGPDR
jgi:hypothetical protein